MPSRRGLGLPSCTSASSSSPAVWVLVGGAEVDKGYPCILPHPSSTSAAAEFEYEVPENRYDYTLPYQNG